MKQFLIFFAILIIVSCSKNSTPGNSTEKTSSSINQNVVESTTPSISPNQNEAAPQGQQMTDSPKIKNYSFKVLPLSEDGQFFKFNHFLVKYERNQVTFFNEITDEVKKIDLDPVKVFNLKLNPIVGYETSTYCTNIKFFKTPTKIYLVYNCNSYENNKYTSKLYLSSISPEQGLIYEGSFDGYLATPPFTSSSNGVPFGPTRGEKLIISIEKIITEQNYMYVAYHSLQFDPLSSNKLTFFSTYTKTSSDPLILTVNSFSGLDFKFTSNGELFFLNCGSTPSTATRYSADGKIITNISLGLVCSDYILDSKDNILLLSNNSLYKTDLSMNKLNSISESKYPQFYNVRKKLTLSNKYLFIETGDFGKSLVDISVVDYENFTVKNMFRNNSGEYDYIENPLGKIRNVILREDECIYASLNASKEVNTGTIGKFCLVSK